MEQTAIRLPADLEAKLINGITTAKRGLAVLDTLEQCGKDCSYTRQYMREEVERAQRILDKFGSNAQRE